MIYKAAQAAAPMQDSHPPRLLWIHQNFVTAREAGNSRPINLVAELLRAGWAVDVVASSQTYFGDAVASTAMVEREGRLSIYRIPAPRGIDPCDRGRSYTAFGRNTLALLPQLDRPVLVLASTPPLPQVLLSIAASVRWQCPLLLEVRDLWPSFLEQGGLLQNPFLVTALRWMEALSYRYADGHVVVAPAFAPYLHRMGVPPRCITIVPTGGDPNLAMFDAVDKAEQRRILGWQGKLVLFYAGSLNEAYGIDLLLDASRHELSADVLWVFAGNGHHRNLVERAAASQENVRYLGSVPKDDLGKLLGAADVGINTHAPWPLLETTITGKLFDYLAAGLPVLSICDGQAGLIIRAAGAGFVLKERSRTAVLEAVKAICSLDPEERIAMGRKGQDWVLRHMHAGPLAADMRRVVEPLAELPTGHRHIRFLRCSLGACGDLLTRRSSTAIETLFTEARQETIATAFTDWLARRSAPQPNDPASEEMPLLLSRRMPHRHGTGSL